MAKGESMDELKTRTRDVIRRLKRAYPHAKCSLNHSNPFELLVATILSAQCTDERVNIVSVLTTTHDDRTVTLYATVEVEGIGALRNPVRRAPR